VGLNLTDFAAIAVLVGTGCVLSYIGLWSILRLDIAKWQQASNRQLSEFADALKALEARVAEFSQAPALQPAAAPIVKFETEAAVAMGAVYRETEEVTPEMLVVLVAAVTAFLGKKVRIRSAKILQPPHEVVNPWSQHGRALVQASHNLRLRG
jgi:methylmalonyl-CoA carboxyltransferase large subunit